jgi:hypothetical protein
MHIHAIVRHYKVTLGIAVGVFLHGSAIISPCEVAALPIPRPVPVPDPFLPLLIPIAAAVIPTVASTILGTVLSHSLSKRQQRKQDLKADAEAKLNDPQGAGVGTMGGATTPVDPALLEHARQLLGEPEPRSQAMPATPIPLNFPGLTSLTSTAPLMNSPVASNLGSLLVPSSLASQGAVDASPMIPGIDDGNLPTPSTMPLGGLSIPPPSDPFNAAQLAPTMSPAISPPYDPIMSQFNDLLQPTLGNLPPTFPAGKFQPIGEGPMVQ